MSVIFLVFFVGQDAQSPPRFVLRGLSTFFFLDRFLWVKTYNLSHGLFWTFVQASFHQLLRIEKHCDIFWKSKVIVVKEAGSRYPVAF